MKSLILIWVLLLMIPIAYAVDCSNLPDKKLCREIQNSGLSEEEKEYLIEDLLDDLKNFPSHESVREWNINVDTSLPPDNVKKYEKGYIKHAWVKLLSVMPSVLENNTLYCGEEGEVLSAFNHEVELPTKKASGDCKTEYILKENKGVLSVSLNNQNIGTGRLVEFTTDRDSIFRTAYDVIVRTDIRHYEWERYCCEREDGYCVRRCKRCEYDHTEYKTDKLRITDSVKLEYYNPNTTADFTVKSKYGDTTRGVLSADNFTSLYLSFANSYLKEFNYRYSIAWDIPPHNVFTVKAEPEKHFEHKNLIFDGNNSYDIWIKDTTRCKLNAYDHFRNNEFPCNLKFEDLNIEIETDKLTYEDNETIKVNIKPSGKDFNLTYANNTYPARNSLTIKAVYPYNRISITHNGIIYDKIIHVKNKDPLNLLFHLSIFGGINYFFIGLLKKYWWF
jgi:hypothetical protein